MYVNIYIYRERERGERERERWGERDRERHVYSYTTEKMLDISVERRFPVNCSGVLYLPKRFTHAP